MAEDRFGLLQKGKNLAQVHEVVIRPVQPVLFNVVDDKSEVRRNPIGLNRGEVDAENLGRGELIGDCHEKSASSLWVRPVRMLRTVNRPDARPCGQVNDLLWVVPDRGEKELPAALPSVSQRPSPATRPTKQCRDQKNLAELTQSTLTSSHASCLRGSAQYRRLESDIEHFCTSGTGLRQLSASGDFTALGLAVRTRLPFSYACSKRLEVTLVEAANEEPSYS